jgi:hypothetical protein
LKEQKLNEVSILKDNKILLKQQECSMKELVRRKRQVKRFVSIFCLLLILSFCIVGCGGNSGKEEATTKSAEDTVAIHAGEINVYLDEARYYAYIAQGTYETYYLTEGKEIDWNKKTKKGLTMETLVKSTVLDEICRRECIYSYCKEYNIDLSEEEQEQVRIDLDNYYKETDGELLSKIGISKERLKMVFQKQAIAEKIENVMAFANENLPDETYKNWKTENTVTAEAQWESITFNQPIFTMEDLY